MGAYGSGVACIPTFFPAAGRREPGQETAALQEFNPGYDRLMSNWEELKGDRISGGVGRSAGQGASTQGYECKKGNDETVAILKCINFADLVSLVCTVHELVSQRVELVAGHKMKVGRFGLRQGGDPIRDWA
jgi:hypothetical protein